MDELKSIIEYAHLRDVKIHITLNTLLNDNELFDAFKFACDVYSIGVDAVIIQDLGLAKLLHTYLPDLPLHASTQLSTHNLSGVKKLKELGFSRVVLARELSIKEIEYICNNTDVEIEIFSHGAQCVSYSGECLMSSMIGDRSGNRGKCAQPCRLPYELYKKSTIGKDIFIDKGYLLSPKDLSTLSILNKLPNISCLKIEGRMKSPEYVATVVSLYRKYIDEMGKEPSKEDIQNIAQIFNRGGFSHAYLEGKFGKDTMCYEKPKNWGLYVGKVIGNIDKNTVKISNECDFDISIGDGIEIWNDDFEDSSFILSSVKKEKNYYLIGNVKGTVKPNSKVYRTSSKLLNQTAKESYSRGFLRHKKIDFTIIIKESECIKTIINDFVYDSTVIPELAKSKPISKEKVEEQLRKTGNTPFEIDNLTSELDSNLFLPISTINEIRRTALNEYELFLNKQNQKEIPEDTLKFIKSKGKNVNYNEYTSNNFTKKKKVSAFFNIFNKECLELNGIDNYYFNFKDILANYDLLKNLSKDIYAVFPIITKGNYEKFIKDNINTISNIVKGFIVSNIGQLDYLKEIPAKELIANYSFNTFNTTSVLLLKELGFKKIILSPELTKVQINGISKNTSNLGINIEVIAYGNVCVMNSEYCPIGSLAGGFSKNTQCSKPCLKNELYYLKDRMSMQFRVLSDNIDCQSKIFNSKKNSIETNSLDADSIRLDFLDENIKTAQYAIDVHKEGNKLSGEEYTNGHFARPV